MAYQAIYRKYRPATFDEIVGQKHIVQTLKNAIARDRIAHAYLFCGPRGTGKTSAAKIFARTLNCSSDHAPCMKCENCRMSLEGSHPDIIEIDAASNNGVDEVRSLVERVGYAPMYGKYKIYIIDEVHMMTTGAFNALLKTIEEPPEFVIFIFATTEPNKVLPTILSRCQRFDFSKVSRKEISGRILEICRKENISIQPEASDLIASMADGGMRDALSILDQSIAYQPDGIDSASVREIYGVLQAEDIGQLFAQLAGQSTLEAVEKLSHLYDNGIDLKRFCSDLMGLLKDSMISDLSEKSSIISEENRKIIHKYFEQVIPQKRMELMNDLMELYQKLGYASNILDYIQTVLLKFAFSLKEKKEPVISDQQRPGRNISESRSEVRKKTSPDRDKSSVYHPKSTLASQFWNSDVSRETSSAFSDQKNKVIFSDDFLLSLLTAGNKKQKIEDAEGLSRISGYLTDPRYARYASSLAGYQITASGENYVLLNYAKDIQTDEINSLQEENGYEDFMTEVLGEPRKIFAVTNTRKKEIIDLYRKRREEGTLPAPAKIVLEKASGMEAVQGAKNPEELIKAVFPDVIIENN